MKNNIGLSCTLYLIGLVLTGSMEDTVPKINTYTGLIFENVQTLPSSSGLKSVLFNSAGTKLYALNLEGMSVYEFDQVSKKELREIKFKPNKAWGWNYALHKAMPSFAEKPVEACFSHHDKILWVSLHNGGGVVPLVLDSSLAAGPVTCSEKKIVYTVTDLVTQTTDTLTAPLILTGKTPKVIAKTADDNYLLVSNWSAGTVSVLKINDTLAPYGRKIATLNLSAIPRGIAVDQKRKKAYVAIMGGSAIAVVSDKNWKIEKILPVPPNPRHIVADTNGRLFISFNALSQVACIEASTGRILFKAKTSAQPRTIALSKNQKFLFVTCYGGNMLDVFKINNWHFSKIYSFKCKGKPVGIALYEDECVLEAWVCNYMAGNLKVFRLKKTYAM